MPQINSGKSPPWVAGEIVTAAELNQMIDSATINPSVITDQTNLTTLTNNEYALVVDTAGALKKTQLKKINEVGVVTDKILGLNVGTALTIQPSGTSGNLLLYGGSSGGVGQQTGTINIQADDVGIWGQQLGGGGGGTIGFTAGSGGILFTSAGGVVFNSNVQFTTTDAVKLPVGTTAQRPAVPSTGDIRYNTTTGKLEFYNGSSWKNTQEAISTGMLLYDVYEEVGVVVSAITHTKPVGEIWIVEIQTGYASGGSHMKFPVYSAASEDVFLGLATGYGDIVTFRKVYGTSTTLTSQTFGFWHWTGNIPTYNNSYFRIYKYRPA